MYTHVIGVDPGCTRTGVGVVRCQGRRLVYVHSGVLKGGSGSLPHRLERIFSQLESLAADYPHAEIALEDIFLKSNFKTSMKMSYVKGMVLLLAGQMGLQIGEYSPRQVKRAVVGVGSASKEQVRFMVSRLLEVEDGLSLDESDALAVAICHGHRLMREQQAAVG